MFIIFTQRLGQFLYKFKNYNVFLNCERIFLHHGSQNFYDGVIQNVFGKLPYSTKNVAKT